MRDPGQHALRRLARGLTLFAALTLPLGAASGVTLTPLPAPGAEAKPYRSLQPNNALEPSAPIDAPRLQRRRSVDNDADGYLVAQYLGMVERKKPRGKQEQAI